MYKLLLLLYYWYLKYKINKHNIRIVTSCLQNFLYLKSLFSEICMCVLKDGRDIGTHNQLARNTMTEKIR